MSRSSWRAAPNSSAVGGSPPTRSPRHQRSSTPAAAMAPSTARSRSWRPCTSEQTPILTRASFWLAPPEGWLVPTEGPLSDRGAPIVLFWSAPMNPINAAVRRRLPPAVVADTTRRLWPGAECTRHRLPVEGHNQCSPFLERCAQASFRRPPHCSAGQRHREDSNLRPSDSRRQRRRDDMSVARRRAGDQGHPTTGVAPGTAPVIRGPPAWRRNVGDRGVLRHSATGHGRSSS